jgi:hypothetical protein
MKGWKESDFLEKLLPSLREKIGAKYSACPDAATLNAVAGGDANAWLRGAVAGHLEHCSECSLLYGRLLQFDQGTLSDQEADWKNTEKRLDNWLEGVLRAQKAENQPLPHTVEEPVRPPRLPFWRMPWALGPATALVLLAAAIYFAEFRHETYRQLAVKTTPAAPLQTLSPPAVRPPTPPEKPKDEKQGADTTKPSAVEVGKAEVANETPDAKAGGMPAKIEANAGHPVASRQSAPEVAEKPADDRAEVGTSAETANIQNPSAGSAVDEYRTEAQSANVGLDTRPRIQGSRPMMPSHGAVIREADIPGASAAPVPGRPEPHPALTVSKPPGAVEAVSSPSGLGRSFRLPAGTRIWVVADPTNNSRDSNFFFRGTLLLPVTQDSVQVLARDTAVYGSGSVSHGRTSLSVEGFIVQGVAYRLTSHGSYAAAGQGSAKALSFESGKVWELWLAADSTYDKGLFTQPRAITLGQGHQAAAAMSRGQGSASRGSAPPPQSQPGSIPPQK